MSKVAIVTDSTAYLPNDLLKEYSITVTPQILIWGDETFQDGVDIQPNEFYRKLETAKIMPTTSQVAIVTMKATFEKLLEAGYDVLGIFLSAKLSGTMQSATQALEMLPKAASKISIVDSNTTCYGNGFPCSDCRASRTIRRQPGRMPEIGRRSSKTYRCLFCGGYT